MYIYFDIFTALSSPGPNPILGQGGRQGCLTFDIAKRFGKLVRHCDHRPSLGPLELQEMIPRYHLPTGYGSLTGRHPSQAAGSAGFEMAAVMGVKLVSITNHSDVIYPRDGWPDKPIFTTPLSWGNFSLTVNLVVADFSVSIPLSKP